MQEFEDTLVEPFAADRVIVPLLRLTDEDLVPATDIKIGEQAYKYACSYPIKGHGAVMPGYLMQQIAAGKKPLLVERPTRYLVYLG